MSNPELNEAFEGIPLVDLTAPDGTVLHFRYGAMIPYAGEEYAVLLEMELDESGEEQVLITRVEKPRTAVWPLLWRKKRTSSGQYSTSMWRSPWRTGWKA